MKTRNFVPALYDIKADFCHLPLFAFARRPQDVTSHLMQALEVEVETIGLVAVTCAYDIYNIEAEALGGVLENSASGGMAEVKGTLLKDLTEASNLPDEIFSRNSEKGRLGEMVKTAKMAAERWPNVTVRGAITGPFTLAAILYGRENILMDSFTDPDEVKKLLEKTTRLTLSHAKLYLNENINPVVFDSFISPPLLSPGIYNDLVLPFHQKLFREMKSLSDLEPILISGGDTSALYPSLAESGAKKFLLDYTMPREKQIEILETFPDKIFRVNLDPSLFLKERGVVLKSVNEFLEVFGDFENVVYGTGILPAGVSVETLKEVRLLLCE